MSMHRKIGEKSELRKATSKSIPLSASEKIENEKVQIHVEKVASVKLQDGDQWFDIFNFLRHDGRISYLAMTSGEAHKTELVETALRNAGALNNGHFSFTDRVAAAVNSVRPTEGTLVIRG